MMTPSHPHSASNLLTQSCPLILLLNTPVGQMSAASTSRGVAPSGRGMEALDEDTTDLRERVSVNCINIASILYLVAEKQGAATLDGGRQRKAWVMMMVEDIYSIVNVGF